jgi:uncharacterized membrane protein
MRIDEKGWLYYALVAVAIVGSMISLFALFELGSPSWTTPVNIVSIICVALAAKTRGRGSNRNDG